MSKYEKYVKEGLGISFEVLTTEQRVEMILYGLPNPRSV